MMSVAMSGDRFYGRLVNALTTSRIAISEQAPRFARKITSVTSDAYEASENS